MSSINRISRRTLLLSGSAAGASATVFGALEPPGSIASRGTVTQLASSRATDGATPETNRESVPATGLVPNTQAGRVFAEWLFAVNTGDVGRLRALYTNLVPPDEVEGHISFDLLETRLRGTHHVYSTLASTEHELTVLTYAALTEEWGELTFGVAPFSVEIIPAHPPLLDNGDRSLSDDELRSALERYLGKLAAADAFSGSVRIARRGEIVYEAAMGLADKGTNAANRVDTSYNLGSINKMFTAVSVAQLVDRGKLAFEDPIARLLTDYPNQEVAERVTVHHLLTHTLGLEDFFTPAYLANRERYREPLDYFELFADEPLKFNPGERFEYNSAAFVVLGAIIERVTGTNYYTCVRDNVFGPAAMTSSGWYERDAAISNLATGYTIPMPEHPTDLTLEAVLGPRSANLSMLPPIGSPAGGGYSTVEDLARFHAALWNHRLLSPEMTAIATTGLVDAPFGTGARYGYGFIDNRDGSSRIVGHGGEAEGISASLDMYPDLDVAVAVLSNYDTVAVTVANRIRRMLAP